MRNEFEKQLVTLNNEMIEMGSMIEKAIEKAIHALVNKDIEVAKEAIEADADIDQQEKKIEGLCLKLLLHQQPVAKDLRTVSSALKMITDMERIGDHAADISEITIYLAKENTKINLELIRKMAKETTVMLVGSIDAFVNKDVSQARDVIHQDDVVDSLFAQVKKAIVELIHTDSEISEQAMDLLMIAKYFERIGDHAVNISEWVIFSITGEHNGKE
ncbi:MAG: phosphate signaling complex protein PhoU [Butyribacter sp.]|nr:phosphate signaling complex protein PhoU [bacterium]MDY3854914.1 phosphate signaling complex protein PhoU [Butyribacter sp.]